jgi:mRNA interferase MazF
MVNKKYIPERGDVVWVDFDPAKGHEQKGNRPAVVVSRKKYNLPSGLVILCPITSQTKSYPFEVLIIKNNIINGSVLVDQIRTVDWGIRKIHHIGHLSEFIMKEIQNKLEVLIN